MKCNPENSHLPDVTLRIHQNELALGASKDLEDALRTYAHTWKMERGYIVITVSGPIYRDEIQPLLSKLTKDTK